MRVIKFSKSYKNISLIKSDFIKNNEKYLLYAKKINDIYKKQIRIKN
jgi:hypothetical protein